MPYYHLKDEQGNIKALRKMDHEIADIMNNELTDGSKWFRGLGDDSVKNVRSATQILRGLNTEGFNEHSMNVVNNWIATIHKDNVKRMERYKKIKDEYRASVKNLSSKDRQAIGKFLGAETGRSFYAGIMLGLSGRVVNDYFEEDEE